LLHVPSAGNLLFMVNFIEMGNPFALQEQK